MPENLFTFQALTTLGGASMLTLMVVQKTKNMLWKWFPTDAYAVLVGAIILLLSQFGVGANPLDWRVYFLSLANGFLIAYVAGKSDDEASKSKV